MIPIDSFIANYPKLIPRTYALRLSEDKVKSFIKEAKELFPFDSSWITDQQSVKSASLNIFERTFTITNTLSILTLIIAGLSIFSTLIVISESRRGQLVPAWAMGVSSKRLAFHEFLRSIILCVLSIIFAIPLGVFITYILTKYIILKQSEFDYIRNHNPCGTIGTLRVNIRHSKNGQVAKNEKSSKKCEIFFIARAL